MGRWIVVLSIGLALCATASAQEKQLYRYTDANGKVVYTDLPPPASAKNVQAKRITSNVIDTSESSLASQRASDRFPVTLYTFACGAPCEGAEALLNKRGVPYTTVNVTDPAGNARLIQLAGSNVAPVLQVGEKLVSQGLNEPRWQAMLDDAGYPRSPSPRRMPPGKGTETPPVAKASSAPLAAPMPAADATAPVAAPSVAPAAPPSTPLPVAGGGYPK